MDGIKIEQVMDIPLPGGKTGTIDLTNQDSGWSTEKIPGRFDAKEITLKGIWASLPGQIKVKEAFGDNKRHVFTMNLPDGTIVTFLGTVGDFAIANEKNAEGFEASIIVFGKADYSTSFASLTAFSVGTGGKLVPTSLAPGDYVVNVTDSTTSVPLTCTDSTADSAIYVNDTANTTWPYTVTTPVGLTDVAIRVTETGKADAFYNVKFARAT